MSTIELLMQQPRFERQWHLHRSRQGRVGIDAPGAWALTCGSEHIKVVVFDTGVDVLHPNLSPNLELPDARDFDHSLEEERQLDDSEVKQLRDRAAAAVQTAQLEVRAAGPRASGLADAEVPFRGLSPAPQRARAPARPKLEARIYNPNDAHGTASAGIVAAAANHTGCVGVAPACRLVPVRISTNVEFKSLIAAVKYAGEVGQVILMPRSLPSVEADPCARRGAEAGRPAAANIDDHEGYRSAGEASLTPPAGEDGARLDPHQFWAHLRTTSGTAFWHALYGKSERDLSAILHAAISEVAGRVPVVCASGNNGTGSLIYPACLEATIAVGACNEKGWRSTYSQYGRGLDVVAPSNDVPARDSTIKRCSPDMLAPGENLQAFNFDRLGQLAIETTDNLGPFGYNPDPPGDYCEADGDYGFGGTSAAAAQVAGVVALMLSINPKLTPREIKAILHETSSLDQLYAELPAVGHGDDGANEEFGHGLVDAAKAVEAAAASIASTSSSASA